MEQVAHASAVGIGLQTLQKVLDGQIGYAEVLGMRSHPARLAVAHGIVHAYPDIFFEPDTQRLRQYHAFVLAFLVGKVPDASHGMSLAETSKKLGWHKQLASKSKNASRTAYLTTPTELVELLLNHRDALDVTGQLFAAARKRLQVYGVANGQPEHLRERATEAVEQLRAEGGEPLLDAVYARLLQR